MTAHAIFDNVNYENKPLIWKYITDTTLELDFQSKTEEYRREVIAHLKQMGFGNCGMIINSKTNTATIVDSRVFGFLFPIRRLRDPKASGNTTPEKTKKSSITLFNHRPGRTEKAVSADKPQKSKSDSTLSSSSPLKDSSSETDSPVAEPKVVKNPLKSIRLNDLITPTDATLWRRTLGLNSFATPTGTSAAKVSEHLLSLSAFIDKDLLKSSRRLHSRLETLTEHLSGLFSHVLQPVYHVWRKDKHERERKELIVFLKFAINNLVESTLGSARTQWETNPTKGLGEFFGNQDRKDYIINHMVQYQADLLLLDISCLFDRHMDVKLTKIACKPFKYSDIANLYFYSRQKKGTQFENFNELVELLRSHDAALEKAIRDRNRSSVKNTSQSEDTVDWNCLSSAGVFLKSMVQESAIKSFKELLIAQLDAQPDHQTQLNNVYQGTKEFLFTRLKITKKTSELSSELKNKEQRKIGAFYSLATELEVYLKEKLTSEHEIASINQQIIKGLISKLSDTEELSEVVPTRPKADDHTFYLSKSWLKGVIGEIKKAPIAKLIANPGKEGITNKYINNVVTQAMSYFVSTSKQLVERRDSNEGSEAGLKRPSPGFTR